MRKATNKSENEDIKAVKTDKKNENKTVKKSETIKQTAKLKNEVEKNNSEVKKTNKTKATNKKIEENRLPNIEKNSENKKAETKNKNSNDKIDTNKTKSESKKKAKESNPKIIIKAEEENNINQEDEEKALLKEENIEINHEKLEKIKNEIKKSKKDSKDKVKNSSLRKNLVRNLFIAIIVTIYFLFIDLGINSIPVTVYLLDLKTFAIFIAIISIIIFERAFKKDENYLAIHGIEMIALGIETLLLLQLYSAGNEYFNYILLAITLGMIAYYLIKCLCIYIRYKVKGK